MSKGRILKMALDELVGGVKKVDLGDLTKKVNVGDRVEAVKRMLGDAGEKVAEKADDWGWKGGKPGEVTGTDFAEKAWPRGSREETNQLLDRAGTQLAEFAPAGVKQLARGRSQRLLEDFQALEQADIPREWTGKLMKAMGGTIRVPDKPGSTFMQRQRYANYLSDTLRQMTPSQREEFLSLLPEWTESLDDLANAVRML